MAEPDDARPEDLREQRLRDREPGDRELRDEDVREGDLSQDEEEECRAAEEAERLVRDAETGGRFHSGWIKWTVFALAIGWSVFQLGIASVVVFDASRARAVHLTFAILITFLVFPARRAGSGKPVPWRDVVLSLVAAASVFYLVVAYEGLQTRFGIPLQREVVLGSVFLILLLEATRRALGPALTVIGSVFLLYAMMGPRGLVPVTLPDLIAHRGYGLDRIISQMYVTTEGVFGVALGVSTQFVFLFVLFGSMLDRAGAGKYFIDVAHAFLGVFRGGPAKAAVVASGLTGMVSGSSLANVVTTGTFTIPLMKRSGYPAYKAGATEVAVSTNGQLMPPVMGAAAFIIAEFTGVPYLEVVKAAFVPAVIAYLALFYIVHLEALKLGLEGLPREELPPRIRTFLMGIHFLLPLGALVWFLVIARTSPGFAVMWAIVTLAILMPLQRIVGALIRGENPAKAALQGLKELVQGLDAGARNMVGIAVAVATAGIVVGVVNLTGLGLRLTEIIERLSGAMAGAVGFFTLPIVTLIGGDAAAFGNGTQFLLVLLITAIASLILGLGLPTTANYIVMATLTAPVIYNLGQDFGYGMPLLAAHLFVFFFGILADDTPPVGLAAYAAAAIARADPIRTGIQGFIYDMRTAILPFMFIFNSKLLLIGVTTVWEGAWIFASALVGMLAFAAATQGFVLVPARWWERLVLLGVAFMLIQPTLLTDLVGLAVVVTIYLIHTVRLRRTMPVVG